MTYRKKTGDEGEFVAENFLIKNGYAILGRKMTSRYGEIDLVANKGNELLFVEVKRRFGSEFGPALESITRSKISKIRRTAEFLLSERKDWHNFVPFFSVIAIDESKDAGQKIEFLRDAFV